MSPQVLAMLQQLAMGQKTSNYGAPSPPPEVPDNSDMAPLEYPGPRGSTPRMQDPAMMELIRRLVMQKMGAHQ